MKFSCTKDNLSKGLSLVSHIAAKNTHLPILQNVLITANGEGMTLTATNLEIGITVRLRGKVEEEGSFTVPAAILNSYIGLLTSERIDIESSESTLSIAAGSQNTKMRGVIANEFPLIPEVENIASYSIPAKDLRTAISQTLIATSNDQSRPELTGVQLKLEGKTLTLASTDSYRLAERIVPLETAVENDRTFVIPNSSLSELVRILPDAEDEIVKCRVSDSQILFESQDVSFTSRLIEVTFPEYQRIIPKLHNTLMVVNTQECIQAIKSSSLFSKTGIHDVSLHCNSEDQSLTITSVNSQLGENVTKLTAEVTGETTTIVFNFRYLLDGLQQMNSETVEFRFIDSATPGVMHPTNAMHDNYLYVIMPIKQ